MTWEEKAFRLWELGSGILLKEDDELGLAI